MDAPQGGRCTFFFCLGGIVLTYIAQRCAWWLETKRKLDHGNGNASVSRGGGQLGGAKSQVEHDWARCEGDEAHQKRELGQRQAGHTRLEAVARAISFCLARLTASNHAEAG